MKGRSKVLVFVLMGQGIQQDHLSYQVRKAKGLRDRLLVARRKDKGYHTSVGRDDLGN